MIGEKGVLTMGTTEVLEGAPKVLGETGSSVLANIEELKTIDKVQRQLGSGIQVALQDGAMDEYDKALAHACLDDAQGIIVAARSPRDVLAALEVFETAVADPEDLVMHVHGLPTGATVLQGRAHRTVSANEQLQVSVGGGSEISLSARQIHDGFFTAEAAMNLSGRVVNPLLVGRSTLKGYLKKQNDEIDQHVAAGLPMRRNGAVYQVADIHGQLMRQGFDASDISHLDPNFSRSVKRNQKPMLALGETLLSQAFKNAVWGKRSAREEKDESEKILLDRTVYTAKALGLTGLEAVVVTSEPRLQPQTDEVSQRYTTVREKVLDIMG